MPPENVAIAIGLLFFILKSLKLPELNIFF